MSINRVILSGNLTRDPELRRTQSGFAIMTFGIAVNDRRRNNQTGEWEDYANFVDVTMFGKRAESLSNILAKGMKVSIEGKLRWSQWERDGQKRSKIEVIADEIELMSRSQGGSHAAEAPASAAVPDEAPAPAPVSSTPIDAASIQFAEVTAGPYDDDIPF